jgi:hypothetical protein
MHLHSLFQAAASLRGFYQSGIYSRGRLDCPSGTRRHNLAVIVPWRSFARLLGSVAYQGGGMHMHSPF